MTQSIESMIEVLQAYQAGKKVEFLNIVGVWETLSNPAWDFCAYEYRIAPEPKKKVKLEAWLSPTGQLMWWLDTSKVNAWSTDFIRVPSEDKEILI